MTKTKLLSVREKIENSNLGSLNSQELLIYLTHRIENLLSKRYALSGTELKYLLCETGPGNLRFDPEIIDLLISKERFPSRKISATKLGEEKFLLYSRFPDNELIPLVHAKNELVQITAADSSAILNKLVDFINNIIKTSAYEVKNIAIKKDDKIEIIIKDKPFIIWFYPDKWIYPHSVELWQLYKKSLDLNLYPIILSRKIHGVCFTLFKTIKVFGSNTYSLYLTETTANKIDDFTQADLPITSNFTPGNISVLPSDSSISNFFFNVLPKYQPLEKLVLSSEHVETLSSLKSSTAERLDVLHNLAITLLDRHVRKHISNWALERASLLKDILENTTVR